jgi:hypothetical protein
MVSDITGMMCTPCSIDRVFISRLFDRSKLFVNRQLLPPEGGLSWIFLQ